MSTAASTPPRRLGTSGLTVSAVGLGCWALGGAMAAGDQPLGYSGVDDAESALALELAVERGVTLFDTADAYGAGHSERMLAPVLAAHPEVLVATKFGNTIDEASRQLTGQDVSPAHVRSALQASLRRLGRERVDVYQVHTPDMSRAQAEDLVAELESLVAAGRVRSYGVSTDDPELLRPFASGPHCGVAQIELNVFDDNPAMLAVCEEHDLGVLCRSPLAMGLLGGRYDRTSRLPADDVRGRQPQWLRWFAGGSPAPEFLDRLDAVRSVLTGQGRSLAQGALAWVLARSPRAVPLPGFRTRDQVRDDTAVLATGPLDAAEFAAVEEALGRG